MKGAEPAHLNRRHDALNLPHPYGFATPPLLRIEATLFRLHPGVRSADEPSALVGEVDEDVIPVRPYAHSFPPVSTVCIPDGVDDATVRTRLRETYNIDIAGGFGPLKGKIWRVGLMGFSSRRENVTLLSGALREILGSKT